MFSMILYYVCNSNIKFSMLPNTFRNVYKNIIRIVLCLSYRFASLYRILRVCDMVAILRYGYYNYYNIIGVL